MTEKKLYVLPVSDVRVGDTLVADGGFGCLREGQECVVRGNGKELYVDCDEGRHGLDGQQDCENYIGFVKK